MSEKIVENQGLSFHGECTIISADLMGEESLPDDAERVEPDAQGRLLVAHSESGHHHYIDEGNAVLYKTSNPLVKYLEVEMDSYALLRHAKPQSDESRHNTQKFNSGLYHINIQREHTPEGWRQVMD